MPETQFNNRVSRKNINKEEPFIKVPPHTIAVKKTYSGCKAGNKRAAKSEDSAAGVLRNKSLRLHSYLFYNSVGISVGCGNLNL